MSTPDPMSAHGCGLYLILFGMVIPFGAAYLGMCLFGSGCPQ